jgi:hypothetical protein
VTGADDAIDSAGDPVRSVAFETFVVRLRDVGMTDALRSSGHSLVQADQPDAVSSGHALQRPDVATASSGPQMRPRHHAILSFNHAHVPCDHENAELTQTVLRSAPGSTALDAPIGRVVRPPPTISV